MSYELRQIQHFGATRRALLTIPPRYATWNAAHTRAQVNAGAVLSCPVLLPDDCVISTLGLTRRLIHAPAMFSPLGHLELHPSQPYLLTETVIHELVHYHQRARMGPPAYAATYLWQAGIAIVKPGAMHDVHIMEAEARRIAREIIEAHFYRGGLYLVHQESVPIDAVREIERRLPTRWAA